MMRLILREIPYASVSRISRRLVARANEARDARQFGVAAGLYQEAAHFNPHNPRIRTQWAHMLKESGDLPAAQIQYELAAADLPNDADLALQIGHLHKLAGRRDAAQASYLRALQLLPGWDDAERELRSVGGVLNAADHDGRPDWVISELLPRGADAGVTVDRNLLRIFRLGGRRTNSRWGHLKTLQGVEAIRGYRLAPKGLSEVRLLLDGDMLQAETLLAYPQADGEQIKYVFNLWHDFSPITPGRHVVDLDFMDHAGRRIRRHRETVSVVAPSEAVVDGISDALVPAQFFDTPLEVAINSAPSLVRDTRRVLLPDPVRTILVQRADQLGDLVCSVPAIRRLRTLFPSAELTGLLTPANAELAKQLGLFDDIVTVEFAESAIERRRVLSIEAQDQLRRQLKPRAFDVAIDLGEGDESRSLLLLSGARFLYGFKDRQSPWLDAGLDFNAHDPVNNLEIMPPSRKILLLVEGLGLLAYGHATPIPNDQAVDLTAYGLTQERRYAVVHAGARIAYSRWPFFAELMNLLLEHTDLKVVLFTDELTTAEAALASGPHAARIHVIAGKVAFEEFDALLAHCTVFIGNDSGPKHLAALRGAPVVSLHMARLNWSEWGQEITGSIISRRVPCAGCGITEGEDCGKNFACIRNIQPQEVFKAVQALLEIAG
ncbi:glycosyltransferase family 9 protein [Sphingomonas sp. ASY06-1R]|uniref:glycosyltransferase family 9 protein n=1 Tax=Sphingomonas sp. ASY06-1R TaxID=3445771 RepID=UPI003FA1A9CB